MELDFKKAYDSQQEKIIQNSSQWRSPIDDKKYT